MQNHFENTVARELTDAELMQIQGGNIFGDAWNAVKHAVSDVTHAVTNAVTHPVQTIGSIFNVFNWLGKHIETKTDQPPPGF